MSYRCRTKIRLFVVAPNTNQEIMRVSDLTFIRGTRRRAIRTLGSALGQAVRQRTYLS